MANRRYANLKHDHVLADISDLASLDHGTLVGLADDDHTQYHNDTRGDARYYTKTLLDAGQLDTRYYTETEVDALTWVEADITDLGAYIENVVEDTTPQLGGSLDVNGNKIVSVSNGNIDIEPNGTGNVLLGNLTFDADQTVGAGQDDYVLTYDNAAGTIGLEAAAGGGGGWTDAGTTATTSGDDIVIVSSLPAGTSMIKIVLDLVDVTSVDDIRLQVGYGATPTWITTGYTSRVRGVTDATSTAGLLIAEFTTTAADATGEVNLVHFGSNVWLSNGMLMDPDSASLEWQSTGKIDMGANEITAVRIQTDGTNTFVSGQVLVYYQ